MKTSFNLVLTISLLVVTATGLKAQTPADVLKHKTEVAFFGIDFSKSKGLMLGAAPEEMRDNYFRAINNLFITEADKYNIQKALMKSKVTLDLRDVDKANQTLDVSSFSVTSLSDVTPLDSSAIAQMVKRYALQDKNGVGLVFICESLDKVINLGTYYLVYFSMPEGKVILFSKAQGTAKGFGMRNYWAHSIYEILQSNLQKELEMKYLPKKSK